MLLVTPESCNTFLDYPCKGTLVSRSRLCVLCSSSSATSVAAAKRMQPNWFDAHRKLVSEPDTGVYKERTRSSQPEFDECDEFNKREKKTFNVTRERIYAGSKSAVRRIPYFEADRDRKLCVVTWGNERKGAGSGILSRLSRAAQATRATKKKAIVLSGSLLFANT